MSNIYGRQVVLPLTNKSGGGVIAGDVVIIDTSNDGAFTTTTSGQSQKSVGIAQETIANNATGRVLVSGYAALVNVPASVTRGHYVETHTVAKQATGNSTRRTGSFGQFLTGGATPTAWLWGFPDNAGATGETVATSTIWDAAGDLAVGTGADTAAKLTKGAAGANLSTYNGTVAWNGGTSFPASPASGDRYWRSDKNLEYYYDGTRWVTTQLFAMSATGPGAVLAFSATGLAGRVNTELGTGTDMWLVSSVTQFFVASGGSALSGSHKWVCLVVKLDTANNSGGTLDTVNVDSGASAAWRTQTTAIGALLGTAATYPAISFSWTKTGTPGNLSMVHTLTFRLVQT